MADRGTLEDAAPMPGAMTPVEFSKAVLAHLGEDGGFRPETLADYARAIGNFGRFLQYGLGVTRMDQVERAHVTAYLDARKTSGKPPTYSSKRVRLTGIRKGLETGRKLGIFRGDPTVDIELGPEAHVAARPLTDQENEAGESHASDSPSRGLAWALTQATGRTSEIGRVRARDVDLERGRVWLPGSAIADPRWGPMTPWGLGVVRRRLAATGHPDEPLIRWQRGPKDLQANCVSAITKTLKAAGLHAPDVRPRSVVAWAARKARLAGMDWDGVAALLGLRSMDEAAEFIGFPWPWKELST